MDLGTVNWIVSKAINLIASKLLALAETSHYCSITFGVPQGFNFRSLIVCFVYKRSLKGLNSTLNIDVC